MVRDLISCSSVYHKHVNLKVDRAVHSGGGGPRFSSHPCADFCYVQVLCDLPSEKSLWKFSFFRVRITFMFIIPLRLFFPLQLSTS